jgi:hypothetical protein
MNTMKAQMDEHTRDLLLTLDDEIAALDDETVALHQKRDKLSESREHLLPELNTNHNEASPRRLPAPPALDCWMKWKCERTEL